MTDKHTHGPWEVYDGPSGYQHRIISDDDVGTEVCDVRQSRDASLIAAAPELYAALHRLEVTANSAAYCYSNRPENFAAALRDLRDDAEAARAALAAARGTKE